MTSIRQLTFERHPLTGVPLLFVALSTGPTFSVEDAGGEPHYSLVGGTLSPEYLVQNPQTLRLLQGASNFYRYWLAGNPEPMELLLASGSSAIDELYEGKVAPVVAVEVTVPQVVAPQVTAAPEVAVVPEQTPAQIRNQYYRDWLINNPEHIGDLLFERNIPEEGIRYFRDGENPLKYLTKEDYTALCAGIDELIEQG